MMPRSKYMDHVKSVKEAEQQAKRDPIRAKILGEFREQGSPIEALGKSLGLKQSATYKRLQQPGDKWELRELIAAAECLHIPMEELTPFLTAKYYGQRAG